MALDKNRLTTLSPLNPMTDHSLTPSPALKYYVSTDTLATVLAANYFSALGGALQVGDRIWAELADANHMLKVTVSTGGEVPAVTVVALGGNTARGQHTSVAASDTVVTGLASVAGVIATLDDAPVIGCDRASASIGDQAGAPAAGSVLLRTWKPTATGDATPIAATTFTKKINWLAWE
jgi:hypothetical protein